jgi:uncharacterized protein YdbL (DUF1318 family)
MKITLAIVVLCCLAFSPACMRHRVDIRTEDPIVIKVEARVDIYNHAVAIEDMVSGERPVEPPEALGDKQTFYFPDPFSSDAFADGDSVMLEAIERRKARYDSVEDLKRRGIAGEGLTGYLEARTGATPAEEDLIRIENEDRDLIYRETARMKGAPLEEVQKSFSAVLRKRAEKGTWIEIESEWVQK